MNKLVTIWRNEKLCQEILPYEEKIITDSVLAIEKKENEINEDTKLDKNLKNFIELDIQRIKFIIKDYLRIRLMKIEKYLFYLLKNNKNSLLSQNEIKFVAELMDAKASYFNQGLKKLNSLTNNFYTFTDKKKSRTEKIQYIHDEMIDAPPKNDFVIVQNISVQNLILNLRDIYSDYEHEFVTLNPGDKCLLPFSLVENLVKDKKVKII